MLEKIMEAAREAGGIMLSAREDKGVETKSSRHDLVTIYDKAVQNYLQKRLSEICPEASFVGEEAEYGMDAFRGLCFVVDPIDGTANFVRGIDHSCVSIGLYDSCEPVLGVVYNPYRDEMFYAKKGEGAWLNGERITASRTEFPNALILFGTTPYIPDTYSSSFTLAAELMRECMDIRRSGSAALDLCYVAQGRADAFFERCLSPWDFAAGGIIACEAGCVFTTMDGKKPDVRCKTSVLVSNRECHEKLLGVMEKYF